MTDVQRGNCDNCNCSVYQVQTGSKRCRGCNHGANFHQVVTRSVGKSGGKTNWKDKMAAAMAEKDQSGAVFYVFRNFVVWSAATLVGWYMLANGYMTPRFERGLADEFYAYTAGCFGIAVIYSYIAYANAQNNEKRDLGKVLCLVNFIAMASYLMQWTRTTPTFTDYVGYPVDPSRFFEWLATCPILIYLIAEITDNHTRADRTASYDYTLIVLGFIACFLQQPYSEWLACCSTIFFFYTIYSLMVMFQTAINGQTGCKLDVASLRTAQIVTFLAWNSFTITWYIQRAQIVTYEQGEIIFCINDIFAKVFLTFILVNATLEESMNSKTSKMESVAQELETQMVQADKLLEKLMPPSIIEAMKAGKATGAEEFASVTVFFSDVTNFAQLSSKSSVKEVLSMLNKLWIEYDVVCKRWGMYKVETIGDAFLGVIGAPERIPDHAERAANFAVDVIRMVTDFRTDSGEELVTRIGLNSGPITAGILGDSNPHWCIVGDAVNTASRMESTSKAMRIHISESTYKLINGKGFKIEGPDVMNIKGKGTMNTYWINGRGQDVQHGNCDKCACSVYQVQTGSKRCRGCTHGANFHQVIARAVTLRSGKANWKDKMAVALSEKDLSGTVYYVVRNFIAWSVATCIGWYILANGYMAPRFDRGIATELYAYTAGCFGIAVIYSYIAYANAQNNEKRDLGKVLCLVNFIAMASYLMQWTRTTPTYTDYVGNPVDPSRFFEWIATCPILIYLIAEITQNHAMASRTASFDYTLLFLGFGATFLQQSISHWFALSAVVCFFYTIYDLMTMFNMAIEGKTGCKLEPVSLRYAQVITLISWSSFAITFHLQLYQFVSYEQGEVLFCISDIFAKVFLTLILVNATLEESMNSKASKLESVAQEIEAQMIQADKLLEKLMPPSLIEAMKAGKATGAEEFASVTVFFSDVTNFSELSNKNSTKDMLAVLNKLWMEYDTICKRWGMYKVETIGDAFLGVIGAPERIPDHAERAANFAVDVIRMVSEFRTNSGEEIVTRVGLNSGPITAGILGDSNPHWCIVGDAVNTASRMESTSKAMRIHISESTYRLINGKGFKIEGPDVMNIKGKGTMNTYWINGRG
ncbi:hypothetical protein HDU98_011436 [Podochytrium sp. JEL0797]|nr:hypothetical protein HDU98_011436 [Podochytrium sp. JEL0797]